MDKIITGKTGSGFAFKIPEKRLHNMELLDALAAVMDGNGLKTPVLLDLLLGSEQKKALYDHVRDKDGMVPDEAVATEITDILKQNPTAKNS